MDLAESKEKLGKISIAVPSGKWDQDLKLSKAQIAYILATAEHESDSFNTLEEYSKGNQYEGRVDLGNTHPGDGVRFKGRGYVQLTGRLNYTRYSEITGLELAKLP